jgi:hypothetical protein
MTGVFIKRINLDSEILTEERGYEETLEEMPSISPGERPGAELPPQFAEGASPMYPHPAQQLKKRRRRRRNQPYQHLHLEILALVRQCFC